MTDEPGGAGGDSTMPPGGDSGDQGGQDGTGGSEGGQGRSGEGDGASRAPENGGGLG